MYKSEQLNELFTALTKAQAEMECASKSKKNPFFKSKYADFAEYIKASRIALTNNNLCVMQRMTVEDGTSYLCSILGHTSGQYVESKMKISPAKNDVQSMGSYITYIKRYSYAALVGVATEDDDAELAMSHYRQTTPKRYESNSSSDIISKEQLEQLEDELKDNPELIKEILEKMGLKTLAQMPKAKFLHSLKRIREIKLIN